MLRTKLRTLIRDTTGFDVHKYEPGQDILNDIKGLVGSDHPVVLDVGANVGQTVDDLLRTFPRPQIHAFEPGAQAFRSLSDRHAHSANLNNFGLGSTEQELEFFESQSTDMSSFLTIGRDGWGGHAIERKAVAISTVDAYCSLRGIVRIDLLKTDTQGFDLEVLKGARGMLANRSIRLVYTEINFAKMYEGQARADEILRFAFDNGFELVSFYKISYLNNKAGWTNALFSLSPQP